MAVNSEGDYDMPIDVAAARKSYPVTNRKFSEALIKLRYDRMDRETQIRAEKTLLSRKDGRYWK